MTYTEAEISLEILRRLGVNTKGKTSGNISIKCWSHNDKTPSLSINIDKGLYHCFACQDKGTLKTKYYKEFGSSIKKDMGIPRELSFRRTSIDFTPIDYNKRPDFDFKLIGKFSSLFSFEAGREWAEKRGFNKTLLENHKVSYAVNAHTVQISDPLNKEEWTYVTGRALFPIYEKGCCISIEARDIKGEENWKKSLVKNKLDPDEYNYKKVLYPKHASVNTLYDLDNLDINKKLYITEGLMDTLSLRTHPLFQNSTTTFGLNIQERQFYLLKKFKELCFIPNLDLPGITALKRLQENNIHATILWLPDTVKDVNDILQKKDPRFSTLEELNNKYNWINSEKDLSTINVDDVLKVKKLI